MSNGKTRVAILGGGPGGISTAYHLLKSGKDLEVTIYQMGWRLGGKGASGRNPQQAYRIEEHGIHLFGCFYPNALHMAWDCYENKDAFRDNFQPTNLQLLTEFHGGRWHQYAARFAHAGKDPWETDEIIAPIDQLAEKTIENIHEVFLGAKELKDQTQAPGQTHWLGHLLAPLVRAGLKSSMPHGDAHVENAHVHKPIAAGDTWKKSGFAARLLKRCLKFMEWRARHSDRCRYVFTQLDHLIGCIHGYKVYDLANQPKGIGSINNWNYLDWLESVGVSKMTLDSPVVKIIPNVCFQYSNGDSTDRPNMAASAYMTFVLRQTLASGNNFYFFREGTGESVILPVYDEMVKDGLKVEFFHKVVDVVPSSTDASIDRIEIEVQAEPKGGAYDPIENWTIDGKERRVWSALTPYDKLVNGDELEKGGVNLESWWRQPEPVRRITLQKGRDFDYVVLAIPIGAHPFACPSLLDDSDPSDCNHALKQSWKTMHEKVHTIPTMAYQLWLRPPLGELGLPPQLLRPRERYAGPCYNNPASGWTDFSDLIAQEGWDPARAPKTLIYFCGPMQELTPGNIPLDDPCFPAAQLQRVTTAAIQDLRHIEGLLSTSVRDDDKQQIEFDYLVCAHEDEDRQLKGEQRIACQHILPNIDPNERYTLSEPGHEVYLKHAWESGYENLALAGDWIFTGFNIGSFEATVMSGKLASYALTGSPTQDEIYGFNFLRPKPKPGNVPMIP